MNNDIEYISSDRVVEKLDISKRTLDRWSKSNLLKKHKIRKKVFYKISDINNLLESQKVSEVITKE